MVMIASFEEIFEKETVALYNQPLRSKGQNLVSYLNWHPLSKMYFLCFILNKQNITKNVELIDSSNQNFHLKSEELPCIVLWLQNCAVNTNNDTFRYILNFIPH